MKNIKIEGIKTYNEFFKSRVFEVKESFIA